MIYSIHLNRILFILEIFIYPVIKLNIILVLSLKSPYVSHAVYLIHIISLTYFIKRRHNLFIILSVQHTCYTYISMFRLYRTVILFIMHFVRDLFNLPHLYRSIDPVNNYSYKTNTIINPLTTYNYFNIPIINIVVAPVKPTYLNYFPFNDITDESLRTELTIHTYIYSRKT